MIGPSSFIWKPGVDRYQIELACQRILAILGPESGILPIHGFEIMEGGAWEKVTIPRGEKPSNNATGKAFAHLFLLVATLSLPDIHPENLAWDGLAFRLFDAETFAGPTHRQFQGPVSRRQEIAERVTHSGLPWTLRSDFGGNSASACILAHLDEAFARFKTKWPAILAERERITGRLSRVMKVGTNEMAQIMPFVLAPNFRDMAWQEFVAHIPETLDREAIFSDLGNACIPVFREPISSTQDGVIEPDQTMFNLLRTSLMGAEYSQSKEPPSLEQMIQSVRTVDHQHPEEPPGFDAISGDGFGSEVFYNDPGLCFGLGGLAYLHSIETALNQPHLVPTSAEVLFGLPFALKTYHPLAGAYRGLGGEYMLGWGLHRLGALSENLCRILDDRLSYLFTHKDTILDLGLGRAGDLLGLARAHDFLPHRRTDLVLWAHRLAEIIQQEVHGILDDQDRLSRASLGFAHGLAGVAFALHTAQITFGLTVPRLQALLTHLSTHLTQQAVFLPSEGPFCRNWGGVTAALHAIKHQEGWAMPSKLQTTDWTTTNGCCGAAAYHLGRLIPLRQDLAPDPPCKGTAPFGYLGNAGLAAIKLARFGLIPDPLWGRGILAARA